MIIYIYGLNKTHTTNDTPLRRVIILIEIVVYEKKDVTICSYIFIAISSLCCVTIANPNSCSKAKDVVVH